MTELERLLKENLASLEQMLRDTQIAHAQELQHHRRELEQLKQTISTLHVEQAEQKAYMTTHLTRLNAVYESLQPLLTRLNALLPGK